MDKFDACFENIAPLATYITRTRRWMKQVKLACGEPEGEEP